VLHRAINQQVEQRQAEQHHIHLYGLQKVVEYLKAKAKDEEQR
jgi:hypothetical protein